MGMLCQAGPTIAPCWPVFTLQPDSSLHRSSLGTRRGNEMRQMTQVLKRERFSHLKVCCLSALLRIVFSFFKKLDGNDLIENNLLCYGKRIIPSSPSLPLLCSCPETQPRGLPVVWCHWKAHPAARWSYQMGDRVPEKRCPMGMSFVVGGHVAA